MISFGKKLNRGGNDWTLIFAVVGLVAFGILMIYSSSKYVADVQYGDSFLYVKKQMVGFAMGLIGLIAMSKIDYHKLTKISVILLVCSAVLLALVFVPFIGIENYGAKRWIGLLGFSIQPSEIAKFAFIIFAATYMSKNKERMRSFVGLLPILIAGAAICVLILLEPNLSITICVGLLMLSMCFVGGMKLKHFFIVLIPLLLTIPILIFIEPYRLNRLYAFLDPWSSPQGEGYQLIQSLYALGSGGFFGVGLFNSRQGLKFLPFAESDFIFSIIGEELGLVGAIAVLCVFIFIIVKAIKIAGNAIDRLGCYLGFGIGMIICIQVAINVAVVTGTIPPTGLPLPFLSYGSTSLVMFMSGVGVLINIKKQSVRALY